MDPSFNPGFGVNGSVSTLAVQPDGKTLVGGQFDHVNALPYNNLARLNADGSVDATFLPPAFATAYSFNPASIKTLTLQPDGRILVGGAFTMVGGQAHANLARLNANGTLDASFSANISLLGGGVYTGGGVYALAVQPDGRIVVAGSFGGVNGQPRQSIARLNTDGTLDTSFDPATPANLYPSQGLNGDVYAVALGPDGSVYAAGGFNLINGVSHRALARLRSADGNLDPSFAPALGESPNVYTVACQPDGRVLVAGNFLQPGDTGNGTRYDLARFNPDGSADTDFSRLHRRAGSAGQHLVLQPQDGAILMAGNSFIDRYLADGRPDKSFFPGLDPRNVSNNNAFGVSAVAVRADGLVVAGGTFDTVDGQFRHNLAGLRGKPSADCPVVNATATVPVAIMGRNGALPLQTGKIIVTTSAPAAAALPVNYTLSGAGIRLAESPNYGGLAYGSLTIKSGTHKTHLTVTPLRYASPGANGAAFKLTVGAGRGYIVGTNDQAKVQVVAAP